MIAAAIVCAAVMSQAATCGWGNEWAYAIDQNHTTYADSGLLTGSYMILLGDTVADVTVLNDGTITYDTGAFTQVAADTFGVNYFMSSIDLDVSNNGKYLTMICFSDDYQIDGNNIYGVAGVELSGALLDPPTDFNMVAFSNDGGGYFVLNQAAQSSGPVPPGPDPIPEPTSGLLLLLGVAGLALKRKRA